MNRSIPTLLVILIVASSCSTSKFDYQTAYKFSHYDYSKADKPETTPEPLASLKPVTIPQQHLPSDQSLKPKSSSEVSSNAESIAAFKESYEQATRTERKAMRKDIKQELKQVRQNMKEAKTDAAQKDVYFNQKMYIGLVVLLAGIVVAILASGAVGALAIIVGVALIAWGFIEQA